MKVERQELMMYKWQHRNVARRKVMMQKVGVVDGRVASTTVVIQSQN